MGKWGAVLEVNARAGAAHAFDAQRGPRGGCGRDILDMLFPKGEPYTIPICAVTGTNGKTTVVRLIAHALSLRGSRRA